MADLKSTPGGRIRLSSFDCVCAHCKCIFKSRYRVKARFCSRTCRYRAKSGIGQDVIRHRVCRQCNQPFSYALSRGADRWFCSDPCRTKRRHANSKSMPLCVVPGCRNPRGYSSGICNGCYCRLRRTGTLERRVWSYRSMSSHGYVRVSSVDHPMANGKGYVYEHRMVLYDAIGQGSHPCHWCKQPVQWVNGRLHKWALVPDHLDGVKSNNDLSNLVPSCNTCNSSRGLFMGWVMRHQDDPWLWRMYQEALGKATA